MPTSVPLSNRLYLNDNIKYSTIKDTDYKNALNELHRKIYIADHLIRTMCMWHRDPVIRLSIHKKHLTYRKYIPIWLERHAKLTLEYQNFQQRYQADLRIQRLVDREISERIARVLMDGQELNDDDKEIFDSGRLIHLNTDDTPAYNSRFKPCGESYCCCMDRDHNRDFRSTLNDLPFIIMDNATIVAKIPRMSNYDQSFHVSYQRYRSCRYCQWGDFEYCWCDVASNGSVWYYNNHYVPYYCDSQYSDELDNDLPEHDQKESHAIHRDKSRKYNQRNYIRRMARKHFVPS